MLLTITGAIARGAVSQWSIDQRPDDFYRIFDNLE